MAYITKATFVVDGKGTEIPAGVSVTPKKLGMSKAEVERYVELGLLAEVGNAPRGAASSESDDADASGSDAAEGIED